MIYFDNSATTRVDDDIARIALSMMTDCYGNPSSLHHFGMDAYQSLISARYQLARMIGAPTSSVYFTSCGTHSNNIAILGGARANKNRGNHIITTAIEHSSVLAACKQLEQEGFSITYIYPDPVTHCIRTEDIVSALSDQTILVSAMHVNSETGEILPIGEISKAVHSYNPNILVHCDAVQSFGKLPVQLHRMKADLLSASGHKIHAPKGIGMLYIKEGCHVQPLEFGGAQEGKINPGTESVPLSCAFGAAAEKMLLHQQQNIEHVTALKNYLISKLQAHIPEAVINSPETSSPYILNFSLPGHLSGDIVDALSMKDIYISAGSACSRGALSHVLQAAAYPSEIVKSALRVSFCETNTFEEVEQFIQALMCTLKGQ